MIYRHDTSIMLQHEHRASNTVFQQNLETRTQLVIHIFPNPVNIVLVKYMSGLVVHIQRISLVCMGNFMPTYTLRLIAVHTFVSVSLVENVSDTHIGHTQTSVEIIILQSTSSYRQDNSVGWIQASCKEKFKLNQYLFQLPTKLLDRGGFAIRKF